jgi:hypothetical protein
MEGKGIRKSIIGISITPLKGVLIIVTFYWTNISTNNRFKFLIKLKKRDPPVKSISINY